MFDRHSDRCRGGSLSPIGAHEDKRGDSETSCEHLRRCDMDRIKRSDGMRRDDGLRGREHLIRHLDEGPERAVSREAFQDPRYSLAVKGAFRHTTSQGASELHWQDYRCHALVVAEEP